MLKNKLRYGMYIHWVVTQKCNFSCVYCPQTNKNAPPHKIDIPKVIKRLNEFNKTVLITLTGGEPFLIPNFTEFVHELTKNHYVRIDTNLSLKKACKKFINLINPEKIVAITFSVHVLEREKRKIRLDDLCGLVKDFEKKGFTMVGSYVLYPPLIERIREDINIFNSHGIRVLPTLFHGTYNKTNYPFHKRSLSYSNEELQLTKKMNPQGLTRTYISRNKPCHAGSTAFAIDPDYNVFPCLKVKKRIGNFFGEWDMFSKVLRCPVDYCLCQFNENFAGSPDVVQQPLLLRKTVHEKGIFSVSESRRLTFSYYQLLLDTLRQTTVGQVLREMKHRWRL